MSILSDWFGWDRQVDHRNELPDIFPIPITQLDFVETDIISIYSKILTDVLERTEGLSDDLAELMWDNCLKSSSSHGLISLLAKAMAHKRDLFLVYEKAVNVVREATNEEQQKIRDDYAKAADSETGVYVSFVNFRRTDMVRFYILMSYCIVGSLYKSMNLSKAVQLKISDLRKSVSLVDAEDVKVQAQRLATALSRGKDIVIDEKDSIETAVPDLTATKEGATFVNQKLCFYLGLPAAYLTGEQTAGIGTTGENDMRAVERGLKGYFFSIIKPVIDALFDRTVSYKSQDFRMIESASDILKTFALIDDSIVSKENKTLLANRLLGLPDDAKGDEPKPEPVPPPVTTAPTFNPAKPGAAPVANA